MLTIHRLDLSDARILIEGAAAKAREIGFDVCGVARPEVDARNQARLDEFVAGVNTVRWAG